MVLLQPQRRLNGRPKEASSTDLRYRCRLGCFGLRELGAGRARKVIHTHLSDGTKSLINTYGFKLGVALRTDLQRDLNGGPAGYIWNISKTVKA